MPIFITTHDTVFKSEPIESSSLGPSEIIKVPAGQKFAFYHRIEAQHKHFLFELASPLTCADSKTHLQAVYAFQEHVEDVDADSHTQVIDRKHFYDYVRSHLFRGAMAQSQVDGMSVILKYWESNPAEYNDLRWLAYILATDFHETAQTMQPIPEYGHGRGYAYGRPDPATGQVYYGRGLVQLTWKENYEKFGQLLHLDLLRHPDLALELGPATEIIFYGMINGSFTGRKLADYFNSQTCDWVHARQIVNGMDRAELIAGYGRQFYAAINLVPAT